MVAYRMMSCGTGPCRLPSGAVGADAGVSFSPTKIVPSGRTSTYSAPACFAARMVRATSARPQSLNGSNSPAPAIATANGRSVCGTHAVQACWPITSGAGSTNAWR